MPNYKLSSQFTERRLQFAARLKELVKSYENASALAREVGVAEGTIRKWANGTSQPRLGEAELLAQTLGVDFIWLATGEGPKRPEARGSPDRVSEESASYPLDVRLEWIKKAVKAVQMMGKNAPDEQKAEAVARVYERFVQTDGQADMIEVMQIIQAALDEDTPYI